MRVRLESGMAPSAARKAAGLPPRPKEKKPQFNERCATEGSSRAAAPPPPPIPVVPVPVIVEEIPEGRQRGKLVYLKEGSCFCVRGFYLAPARRSDLPLSTPSTRHPTAGKFGFIRPRDAKSKDDHAFFNMNELCVFTASLCLRTRLFSSRAPAPATLLHASSPPRRHRSDRASSPQAEEPQVETGRLP